MSGNIDEIHQEKYYEEKIFTEKMGIRNYWWNT